MFSVYFPVIRCIWFVRFMLCLVSALQGTPPSRCHSGLPSLPPARKESAQNTALFQLVSTVCLTTSWNGDKETIAAFCLLCLYGFHPSHTENKHQNQCCLYLSHVPAAHCRLEVRVCVCGGGGHRCKYKRCGKYKSGQML